MTTCWDGFRFKTITKQSGFHLICIGLETQLLYVSENSETLVNKFCMKETAYSIFC